MEALLVQLSLTNVELAICEEEAESRSRQVRTLQATNQDMATQLLQASQHRVASLGEFLAPSKPAQRDSLDTQDSPRFVLLTECSDIDPGKDKKCRQVLAKWDKYKGSWKMRKAVKLGFPKQLRGELWQKAIGNPLRLQPHSLSVFFDQSKDQATNEDYTPTNLIPLDVKRTLTHLQTFQEDQPLHQPLKQLLYAFNVRNT